MELEIKWQRLVKDGETCERCSGTEEEIEKSVERLEDKFGDQVEVSVVKDEIGIEEFNKKPERSNRIFINGTPVEKLADAEEGKNDCCDVCGDNECRTLEKDGQTYEKIPAEIIVKAGVRKILEKTSNFVCGNC